MTQHHSTTRRRSRTVGAVLLAAALVVGAGTAQAADPSDDPALEQQIAPDQELADDVTTLDRGHVDLGPRLVDDEWTFMVHDDTSLQGSVWREFDRTVLRVSDAALQEVPDDDVYSFLGVEPGAAVHVVPQTENGDVVWVGWNTQDPAIMDLVDRGVTLSLTGVDGPGHLVLYLQDGGFGEPDVLWDSRIPEKQSMWVDVNTHTHANWVFSEPGTYLVQVEASADLVDGGTVSDTRLVRFAVGDGTDPDEALEADFAGTSATAEDDDASAAPAEDDGSTLLVLTVVGLVAVLVAVVVAVLLLRGRRARRRARDEEV